ncbi:unnamed protein product [Chrysoparadoxa australica]
MQQWWAFKSQNMDTVLFFKVGKFYELFHMDADIGMEELDLIYMKGEKAHSGFPEISYGKYSNILVQKGYKVARVEQTETPQMLKERNSKSAKHSKDKVVRRELCSIMSSGTRTYCFLDSLYGLPNGSGCNTKPLLSIKEKPLATEPGPMAGAQEDEDEDAAPKGACEYGITIVDCTTASFSLGQFADDKARSRLRTLLAQIQPAEILQERNNLSETTLHLIKCLAPGAKPEVLMPGTEFFSSKDATRMLEKGKYFDEEQGMPELLQAAVAGKEDSALCLSSLGGVLWHLKRSLIDHDMLSMRKFTAYVPPDDVENEHDVFHSEQTQGDDAGHLVLDGVCLANLEVLQNTYDGSEKGSLWGLMNRCSTAFGKRLLREWVCKPLLGTSYITQRLDAVEELCQLGSSADALRNLLRKLPDIERLLSRVHSMASLHRSEEHPESRAIMYETDIYSAKKIRDFLDVLDGLELAMEVPEKLDGEEITSSLLQQCLKAGFPDMTARVAWFRTAFDAKKAKSEKTIKPREGTDAAYDATKATIAAIKEDLEKHLVEQQKSLSCKSVVYFHTKDRYQLQVPDEALKHGREPSNFDLKSKKKGFLRFWTPFIKTKLEELAVAEAELENGQRDQMRRIFAKFDESRGLWASATQCLAHLDALLSLADVSAQPGFVRPQFVEGSKSFIRIKAGRHPCLEQTYQGGDFIPNDVSLGQAPSDQKEAEPQEAARMLLLTGPNMGGKSTLLRQTCLAVIMAQIGCFVAAESVVLTPFDRIFTRIGASDRILAGQSTFYVELSETANILHHATERSLVILDELGRGTSTFDGTAIAHAVVSHLVKKSHCLVMFATHYHSLTEDWNGMDAVALGHMDCLVEGTADEQNVTFLYKLAKGACPKSFGINVARLAQLPAEVLAKALAKSQEFEAAQQEQALVSSQDPQVQYTRVPSTPFFIPASTK